MPNSDWTDMEYEDKKVGEGEVTYADAEDFD